MIIAVQALIYFRESLLGVLDRFLRPYYIRFARFNTFDDEDDVDEVDEQVFADFDDEKGVVFFPPVYLQRYAAVTDCLIDERWCGKLEKVVDLGYNDMSFIKYLKQLEGVKTILGVDLETVPVRCTSVLLGSEGSQRRDRDNPLDVTLFQGNAADPDYRLIGCDAVTAIEMIEHMLPQDLERLVHNIFGFIKPWVAVITTPNGDFNVLFKAMEKNGFRRMDHFFEWTREQFSDWCSNIIDRYPDYMVSYKGIGPGPPGTQHHGCCSQLALFVAKDYHKQANLNLHSWLVSDAAPNKLSQIVDGWETSSDASNNMLAITDGASLADLHPPSSEVTIYFAPFAPSHRTPPPAQKSTPLCDKSSQCNIAVEVGRSYVMFDENIMYPTVLVPRRTRDCRVYEIGDVASSLNCTTLQVNKFSKATHSIVARNKADHSNHTNAVVSEIKQLTKMLDFSKPKKENAPVWNNINWGDNAPYWNQYYEVVREFNYPTETKSEAVRILEIITNEVNSLVDKQYEYEEGHNQLKIPLDCLMPAVRHITDDVDQIREVLEWNGYDIQNNCVIHTIANLEFEDCPVAFGENDSVSDWDADVHSTLSISDGSTVKSDYGCNLRRALERKVRKLQSMTSIDKELSLEMDQVLCRLMKLALTTSSRRQSPPPSHWLKIKLYDLLSLTEKAIVKRREQFVQNYLNKGLEYGNQDEKYQRSLALIKYQDDSAVKVIEDKYRHLVEAQGVIDAEDTTMDLLELDDDFSATSKDFKDFDLSNDDQSSRDIDFEPILVAKDAPYTDVYSTKEDTVFDRTQAWLEDDLATPTNDDVSKYIAISLETLKSADNASTKTSKSYRKHRSTTSSPSFHKQMETLKKRSSEYVEINRNKTLRRNIEKSITYPIKMIKNVRKRPSHKTFVKEVLPLPEDESYLPIQKKTKPEHNIEELFHAVQTKQKDDRISYETDQNTDVSALSLKKSINISYKETSGYISATEDSQCIEIVMDGIQETITLKRTIGTDPDLEVNNEYVIAEAMGTFHNKADHVNMPVPNNSQDNFIKHNDSGEDLIQAVFIYDINEPSTSKGVRRHVHTDVKCGTDSIDYTMLSRTATVTKVARIFSTGVKIGDSIPDLETVDTIDNDYGTCPDDMRETEMNTPLTFYSKEMNVQVCQTKYNFNPEVATGKYIYRPEIPLYSMQNPTIFTAKLEIHDSMSNVKAEANNNADFGTSTDVIIDKTFANKYSADFEMCTDGNVCMKIEAPEPVITALKNAYDKPQDTKNCLTLTESDNVIDGSNAIDPKVLIPTSSKFNIDGSVSELYRSFGLPGRSSHSPSSNGSTKYKQAKLSCVGSQVHTYKERQVSEDVLYQGIWKKQKPQRVQKNIDTSSSKRFINASRNKDEPKDIKANSVLKKFRQKSLPLRNTKVDPMKPQQSNSVCLSGTKTQCSVKPTYVPKKNVKLGNNVTKVTSKISTCSVTSKGTKIAFGAKITYEKNQRKMQINNKNSKAIGLDKNKSVEKKGPSLKETKLNDNKENINRNAKCPKVNKRDQERNIVAIMKLKEGSTKPEIEVKQKYCKANSKEKTGSKENDSENKVPPCKLPVIEKHSKPKTVNKINVSLKKKQILKGNREMTSIGKDKYMNKGDTKSTLLKACNEINKELKEYIEIRKDLLAYHEEPFQTLNYNVFCNEIQVRSSDADFTSPKRINNDAKNRSPAQKRETSPGSDLSPSSDCSSVNSVVTIRSINTPGCNTLMNSSPIRKNTPVKISPMKICKSSRQVALNDKVSDKKSPRNKTNTANVFKTNADVFVSQFTSENVLSHVLMVIKPEPPAVISGETSGVQTKQNNYEPSDTSESKDLNNSSTLSDIISRKSDIESVMVMDGQKVNSATDINNGPINEMASKSDDIVKLTSEQPYKKVSDNKEQVSDNTKDTIIITNQSNLFSEIITKICDEESTIIDISIEMREILEEIVESRLPFKNYDSKTVILSRRMADIAEDRKEIIEEDTGSEYKSLLVDTDTCSFKSTNSLSKYSDSYFGDSEHTSHDNDETSRAGVNADTVKDLFERKDTLNMQPNVGPMTMQAFSGFSMNAEPATGERPAYINYVDSEVGMPPYAPLRQTTSEEMRVSARSSNYETAPEDDDSTLPNWLFQLVNNVQEPVEEVPSLLPHEMAMLEVGGAAAAGAGRGARGGGGGGAGDGCGMHSDRSPDSSGRGSSASTSQLSEPSEEGLPVDPVRYDRYDDTTDSLLEPHGTGQSAARASSTSQLEEVDSSIERFRMPSWTLRVPSSTSDRDADVSSMETDVPNSGDVTGI